MKRIALTHESPTRHGQFSPDGTWVLTAEHAPSGRRGGVPATTARLWSADTGTPQTPFIEHVADRIEAVAFAPDSKRFLTATANGLLQVFSVCGGEMVSQWKARSGLVDAAWLPDGSAVIAAQKNKSLSMPKRSKSALRFGCRGRLMTCTSLPTAHHWPRSEASVCLSSTSLLRKCAAASRTG